MDVSTLDQKNPAYDAVRWSELTALAKGGKSFHEHIDTFLPQNPLEPHPRYAMRQKRAKYYSYTGAIINLYVSWLFAAGFEAKPYERDSETPIGSPDKFYGTFQEDVGGETTLKMFMKDRFREAMTQGKSVWLAELPQAPEDVSIEDRKTYEDLGLGNARLARVDVDELLDWEENDDGSLNWCILKSCWDERSTPQSKRDTMVEQWRIYESTTVTTYEVRRKKTEPCDPNKVIAPLSTTVHGFPRCPVMRLELPAEMCVGEQTYDAQVSHFQHDNALSWAIYSTCYAMPVFHLSDDTNKPTMGTGYALYLGEKETLDWASPPADSFDTIAKNRDSKRDEIFRIVHQMAQGLDNNAETVGRSADSKEIDAAATRIMLNAYGEIVGKAIEDTYELISEARGDDAYEWSVEGFSGYDTATASSLIANAREAKSLGIPSNTFQREITKKAALALLPELDPRVKDAVRKEIGAFDFEPSGLLLEERVQAKTLETQKTITDSTLESNEKISTEKVTSQEKTAKLAAKAQANKPKPKPRQ